MLNKSEDKNDNDFKKVAVSVHKKDESSFFEDTSDEFDVDMSVQKSNKSDAKAMEQDSSDSELE